jgi:tRNA threonylcarbamoyl adenosine modification protein YeaZ
VSSVLAIDTSSRGRVVCVAIDGDRVSSRVAEDEAVTLSLPRMLRELRPPDLSAVVVVTGPGSYTGLRAGMAAAAGLAHALSVPLHGAGTLDIVAAGWDGDGNATAAVDAGRGGVYEAPLTRAARSIVVAPPRRIPLVQLQRVTGDVVSTDALDVPRLVRVDAAIALARAVPHALARRPLPLDRLVATYLDMH